MSRAAFTSIALALAASGVVLDVGCGGSDAPPPKTATVSPGGNKDPSKWPKDDRSMCADWRTHPELEVSETAGPGALRPNIRRVYKTFGEGETRHKSLVCRELDANLDGIKDVARTFNAKGEAQHEEADTNFDGKVDVWMNFVGGRLAEEDVDENHDGKPDVWKFYTNGDLSRIKRDRNFDGQPDVWEIYTKGVLERMGVDSTYDGHVDRWDRDDELRAKAEAADRQTRDQLAAAAGDGGAPTATPTQDAFIDAGAAGTSGKKPAAKKK